MDKEKEEKERKDVTIEAPVVEIEIKAP